MVWQLVRAQPLVMAHRSHLCTWQLGRMCVYTFNKIFSMPRAQSSRNAVGDSSEEILGVAHC